MTGHCNNPTNWPEVALGTMIVTSCPPGGKFNPHCCMHNPHLLEMESWGMPILRYILYVEKHRYGTHKIMDEISKLELARTGKGGGLSLSANRIGMLEFTGIPKTDWEIIAAYVNVIAEHGGGIVIDDTSNPLSDLANKILEAVQNKDLTIISATATCVIGACGYTTLHKVVAGHHPEMVEKLKTDP